MRRKLRTGTWSASNTATNSPVVRDSAWLMFPAFAPRLSGRVMYDTPSSSHSAFISGRRFSSSSHTVLWG